MRALGYGVIMLVLCLAGRAETGELAVGEAVVRSDEQSTVKSKVAGPIRWLMAEGSVVRRREVLVEIANDVERAQIEAAQAAVAAAQAELAAAQFNLEVAQRELARNLDLGDLITGRELDLSRDAVRRGAVDVQDKSAQVARAQGQLAVAQANLEQTYYRAPYDGLIARRYLQIGDTPMPGETVILDLLSRERLYAEVALPLAHFGRVHKGMAVQLELHDAPGGVHPHLPGVVQFVYPELDTTTRTFRVKVALVAVPASVALGSFVKVIIPLSPVRQ